MRQLSINWIRVVYFNLLTVAFVGVILRYKIVYSLPFIEQKNLLHGHSHFAFAGWITQALMFLLIFQLKHQSFENILHKYNWLLIGNLITAWGMLLSFPFQGYGFYSILFSTLSIIVSYAFAIIFWKDLNQQKENKIAFLSFKAALIFSILSSFGAFGLAAMMIKHIIIQKWSLLLIYFFLHFQYNGWFFFACLGLLFMQLEEKLPSNPKLKTVFWLLAASCIPAYLLSALWLPIPKVIYIIIILAAFAQLAAWLILLQKIVTIKSSVHFFQTKSNYIFVLVAIAFTIKLLLQIFSTVPALSQISFGFRPIVVGYLHLVLLATLSLFITGFFVKTFSNYFSKKSYAGIIVFICGIISTEILLLLQGSADIFYIIIPFINELLFVAALMLFAGILLINLGLSEKKNN
jgi:hypothetical protein